MACVTRRRASHSKHVIFSNNRGQEEASLYFPTSDNNSRITLAQKQIEDVAIVSSPLVLWLKPPQDMLVERESLTLPVGDFSSPEANTRHWSTRVCPGDAFCIKTCMRTSLIRRISLGLYNDHGSIAFHFVIRLISVYRNSTRYY